MNDPNIQAPRLPGELAPLAAGSISLEDSPVLPDLPVIPVPIAAPPSSQGSVTSPLSQQPIIGQFDFFSVQQRALALGVSIPETPVFTGPRNTDGILLAPGPADGSAPLTDREIFELLYPVVYLDALRAAQGSLVSEGVIAPNDVLPLHTEAEVKTASDTLLRYLRDQGAVDTQAYEISREAADQVFSASYEFKLREAQTIKAIQEGVFSNDSHHAVTPEEALDEFREVLRLQGYDLDAILRGQSSSQAPSDNRLVLSRHLIAGFRLIGDFFMVGVANAACGPTYCIRPAICFVEGAGGPVGANFPTPCCFGRICGVPIGCFELCGEGSRPLIWDPVGICGCG